jgi:thiamine-monophosphate kinase
MGELREWELLEELGRKVPGCGDDCAVLPFAGTQLLLTTDLLHQASDFPPGTTPYTMGWRAVAASLSDIAAMAGRPLAVVMAASAPDWEGLFPELLAGAQAACRLVGTELVGGDLDFSGELFLVSSALGEADRPVRRAGAQPGDCLFVTGPLGSTHLALRLFSQGKSARANELFRFVPRVTEGLLLAGEATSMIDLSDSLAHSLHLLSRASRVGFVVHPEKIPLVPGVELEEAIYFGEDYELLFTAQPGALPPGPWTEIGQVVEEPGVWLSQQGKLRKVPDRGWEHGP